MASNKKNIFSLWAKWHFIEMPKFLLQVWKNYLMFASNYFSVILLLKTFFYPWKKYNWKYPRSFNIQEFFNTFISNTFSRLLGALMRIILIIAGIFLQIFIIIIGAVIFAFWVIMPVLVIIGLLYIFYV